MPTNDAYEGSFTLNAAAVAAVMKAAGLREQSCFDSIAAAGGTTTTPPLTDAQKAQAYVLDADAVEACLAANGNGLEARAFLTALLAFPTP